LYQTAIELGLRIPKVHLQETVEELKKFNARRKLKVYQKTASEIISV
jgi:hypothetical protein